MSSASVQRVRAHNEKDSQLGELARDGVDHGGRHVVAQVGADRLRRPVDELAAVRRVQVDAIAGGDDWRGVEGISIAPGAFLLKPLARTHVLGIVSFSPMHFDGRVFARRLKAPHHIGPKRS